MLLFLFQLCVLHDLVLLLIQVLLILCCDRDQVSLRLAVKDITENVL